jgi:hypothetical protein
MKLQIANPTTKISKFKPGTWNLEPGTTLPPGKGRTRTFCTFGTSPRSAGR